MRPTTKITTLGLLAALAATAVTAPVLADPSSQQKNKNNWRNLGFVGAAVAGYGLLTHNNTATLLGAAGAAYSADRYEQDRHNQSQDNANRQWYYQNNDGYRPTNGYGYGRTYGGNSPAGDNNGYDNSGYNNGYDNGQQAYARRDNGRHLGWHTPHDNSDRDDNNERNR